MCGSETISCQCATQPAVRAMANSTVTSTRNSQRAVDDTRVKVDIRIRLSRHKIFVFEGYFFEYQSQFEKRIVANAQLVEHAIGTLLDDLGARIEVLVHAMAESHQPHAIRLVFDPRQEFADVGG